ncbi:protein kinase [Streptomyces sp. NPDC007901]|uniref:serine/threonine protein kinase n=1 Tax=Streptomyces sp. NPDC007901 TaxID=3364785 RepID=UPI0036E9A4F2
MCARGGASVSGSYGQGDGTGRLLAGRYRVVARLGRGGMGVVWRAVDEVLGREVAVKELRAYTDSAGPELAGLRLRMQREARAAARVRHPGVIVVHDIAQVEGRPLIVMELVDGPSLDDLLRERGTLGPHEAARIGVEVMDALAAAHRVGVLHRDVKPGNILLDRSGRVVLTDFGIATIDDPGDGSATHLTGSGELVGSLDYLAPERAKGADPGPASDIWALGAALYAAVEGASPFRRTSTFSTLTAIVDEPLPEPRHAGRLAPVLRRLMDKRPEARPDAEEACDLLRAAARGPAADTPTTTLRDPARPGTGPGTPLVPPGHGPADGAADGFAQGGVEEVGGRFVPGASRGPEGGLVEGVGEGLVQGAAQQSEGGLAQGGVEEPGGGCVPGASGRPDGGLAQGADEGVAQGLAEGLGREAGEGAVQGRVERLAPGSVQGPAHGLGPESAEGVVGGLVEGTVEGAGRGLAEGSAEVPLAGFGEGAAQEPAMEPGAERGQASAAGFVQEAGTQGAERQGAGPVFARRLDPGAQPAAPDGPMSPVPPRRTRRRARMLVVVAVGVVLAATVLTVTSLHDKGRTTNVDSGPPAPTGIGASEGVRGTGAGRTVGPDPLGQGEGTSAVPADGATRAGTGGSADPTVPAGDASATPPPAQTAGPSPSTTAGSGSGAGTATATPAPACQADGDGTYACQVRSAAKSYTASGDKVGKVHPGTHSFYCQADLGWRETHGKWTNVWWARTDDDNGNTGVYISDVYIEGGENDEPVPGLPVC